MCQSCVEEIERTNVPLEKCEEASRRQGERLDAAFAGLIFAYGRFMARQSVPIPEVDHDALVTDFDALTDTLMAFAAELSDDLVITPEDQT